MSLVVAVAVYRNVPPTDPNAAQCDNLVNTMVLPLAGSNAASLLDQRAPIRRPSANMSHRPDPTPSANLLIEKLIELNNNIDE